MLFLYNSISSSLFIFFIFLEVKGGAMSGEAGIIKEYKHGDLIFKEGDRGREMYIIRSGNIKVFREREGEEITFAILQRGDFFGEMALFGNYPRSASAQAVDSAKLQVIDVDTFLSFIKEPIVWTLLRQMGERIREVDKKLEELSLRNHRFKETLSSLLTQKKWFV
jgi:CRP-like cAMP-binding protein